MKNSILIYKNGIYTAIVEEVKEYNDITFITNDNYKLLKQDYKKFGITRRDEYSNEIELNLIDKETFDQIIKYLNSKYKKPEIIKELETTDLYKIYNDDKVVNYVNELYSNKELYNKTLKAALYLVYDVYMMYLLLNMLVN